MKNKLPLRASNPSKIPARVKRIIAVKEESEFVELRKAFPFLTPRGPDAALNSALTILGTAEEFHLIKLHHAIQLLLASEGSRSALPKAEMAKLHDIEAAAYLLEARLNQLDFSTKLHVLDKLKAVPDRQSSNLDSLQEFETLSRDIALAAREARELISKDGGGIVPKAGRPSQALPVIYFLQDTISVFAAVRGVDAVTSTVTKNWNESRSCFAFAANLYVYALDRPMGHVRQFKALVAEFQDKHNTAL